METATNVEISVKPEPMDTENVEDNHQSGFNQETNNFKEEEVWIKPEPQEDESQDSIKKESQETGLEAKAKEYQDEAFNRLRQTSPSSHQLHVFLDFLTEHRDFACCSLRGVEGRAKAQQLWENITNILNSIGGCTKTTQQWQRLWSDKKYLAKKAAAARSSSIACGGPPVPKLSRQDKKILAIIGDKCRKQHYSQEVVASEIYESQQLKPVIPTVILEQESIPAPVELPSPPIILIPPAVPPPHKATPLPPTPHDKKSKLPLKKRKDKTLLEASDEDEKCTPKKDEDTEKNISEENEQQTEKDQPKMETPLMYSYEITKNIEIVTISEEERQKEYHETLKSRQHMRHVCEHCALGFVLEQAYLVHMKVHAPESGEHECLLCHSRLKTADMLYRHRLRHYRRYRCLLCRTRFKDKDTAACHVMTDHVGQAFECDRCGRGFKRPQYLKRHVEQYHTKPHRLECGICFRVFHERGWYRSHIRTHNEEVRAKTVKLPATCGICSRDFKCKASLKRHLLTHDTENVHCKICYEKCKNRITLGQHYLKMHNEKYEGTTEETCPQCMRVCATRAMLKRHMQRMHSDRTKKYQCDHCQRLYLTKGEVRSHIMWSHMPAESRGGHACACGRIFRTPSLLRDHAARFHAPEPPPRVHQCEHCEKAFANKQVLNRHKKSHSNEMYPCNECGLLFKTQPYVKIHYQIKHLNMTRAQISAQRKLNKNRAIQNNIHNSTNWEPPISDEKGASIRMDDEDPLLVHESDIKIKIEPEDDDLHVPMFQTFVDITRE